MCASEDNELWSFETAKYRVSLHAVEEGIDPEDSFKFPEDVAFARSGDPAAWFCAIVRVIHLPTGLELGGDSLGGCSYRSFREFYTGHRDPNPENRNTLAMKARGTRIGHYFPDMVRQAVAQARDIKELLCK